MEAVVSDSCPLVGKSIRDGRFRGRYNAVVIAVARNGERIERKIGDIVLRPGDTLLIEADPQFRRAPAQLARFFPGQPRFRTHARLRQDRALIAIVILVGMVAGRHPGLAADARRRRWSPPG